MDSQEVQGADLARFKKITADIDDRAGRILVCHAALEAELNRLLTVLLPRGELLSKLSYTNKTLVLRAAWPGDPDKADALSGFLVLVGELRNAIAHGDKRRIVDAWIGKLQAHYAAMPGSDDTDRDATITDMVSDISGTLAGLTYKMGQSRPPYPPRE